MSYATVDDLKRRLGAVGAGIYRIDPAAAEADLADAAAEVDASVAVRYELPVPPGAPCAGLLRGWTLTLAEELAWSRSAGGELSAKLIRRVDAVRAALTAVAAGKFTLKGACESRDALSGVAIVEMDAPVFGRDRMTGY